MSITHAARRLPLQSVEYNVRSSGYQRRINEYKTYYNIPLDRKIDARSPINLREQIIDRLVCDQYRPLATKSK